MPKFKRELLEAFAGHACIYFIIFQCTTKIFRRNNTAQKMKFSIKVFLGKYDQSRETADWVTILKKYLMENFIFCAVRFMGNF